MATLADVVDTSFDAQVLKCDIPVLANFWAEWCGPCQVITPYLEEIAAEYGEKLKIVKLDLEENPLVASTYQVLRLPTLMLFKFGQPVEYITGPISKEEIIKKVRPYLDW